MSLMTQNLTLLQVFSQPVVPLSFFISFSSLVWFFFYCIQSGFTKTEKQISWILTFASSLICTMVSIPNFFVFWKSGCNMKLLSSDSSFHTALACFFITYLVLDLSLGSIYYRSRITVLTGWIHHPLYIGILFWLLKSQSSSFFSTSAVLELPTLLLALGSFRDHWRSDLLFASTFFMLRLVLHSYMIIALKQSHRVESLWIVAVVVFPLHLYWFYGIVGQLIKKYSTVYKLKTDGMSSAVVHARGSKHSFLERMYTI